MKYKFVNKALETVGSAEKLIEIIDFVFDNWIKVKEALKWEGTPAWGMFNSPGLLRMLRDWCIRGIPNKEWSR